MCVRTTLIQFYLFICNETVLRCLNCRTLRQNYWHVDPVCHTQSFLYTSNKRTSQFRSWPLSAIRNSPNSSNSPNGTSLQWYRSHAYTYVCQKSQRPAPERANTVSKLYCASSFYCFSKLYPAEGITALVR